MNTELERRLGSRLKISLPVQVKVQDSPKLAARLRDVNARGLGLESVGAARVGDSIAVDFDGYPGVCDAFSLNGEVVRIIDETAKSVGVAVNRKTSAPEAVQRYRTLVLHYLHHRPLMEGMRKGYLEGRCTKCGWVGRVGERAPRCAQCGGSVESVRS